MQFTVIGYDGKDSEAPARRQAARPDHLKNADQLHAAGHLLFAVALLDETGEQMVGSVMICDFESRAALDLYLKDEPYVTGQVWKTIKVIPCRVGPTFAGQKH